MREIAVRDELRSIEKSRTKRWSGNFPSILMWVRRAAIRAVPPYARLTAQALERVEQLLSGEDEESEEKLEEAFARFERTQPSLSSRVAAHLAKPAEETSLALGYFLSLAVWMAFENTFGSRLVEVTDQDLEATAQAIAFDQELREDAPEEAVDTDDVVAMEQPDVVEFIREHIDVALETNASSVKVDEVDAVYRLVLMEVVALSHSVQAPDRYPVSKQEFQALDRLPADHGARYGMRMPKMEAMVLRGHGGPEVLARETVEIAGPGAREVLVRVKAVAMNHMDLWVRRGLPNLKHEYPFRLGCDIAGVVEELGEGARGTNVGERVLLQPGVSCGVCNQCLAGRDNLCKKYKILGENTQGGYGELIAIADTNILPMPANLSFEEGAALPLCTLTAWQMVHEKARVSPGQTVLVQAAGSGVSSIAIQLCKRVGARVITTTSSDEKAERARKLGADEVINYTTHDFVAEVKRLTDKAGVDVVLEHVGGEVFEKSVLAVKWGGRIVTVGATAGFSPKIDLRQIFFRQVEVLGSTMGSKGGLCAAMGEIAAGHIKPVVDRAMPLWEAREAHALLEARKVFGKIVLSVS